MIDTHVVDVADIAAVMATATSTAEALGGRIHVLINNAGITGPNATTWEYPAEAWRRVMAIDLDGVFHCCRAVVPFSAEPITAASSTSLRSPVRRVRRTRRPTARRKPA